VAKVYQLSAAQAEEGAWSPGSVRPIQAGVGWHRCPDRGGEGDGEEGPEGSCGPAVSPVVQMSLEPGRVEVETREMTPLQVG